MGQNRATASIALAVALSLALGGVGGYLLGREHGADNALTAYSASDCKDATRAFEEALAEVGDAEHYADFSAAPEEDQAEADYARTKAAMVVDQNPDCFDAETRAVAATHLEGEQ
ncbi:hypothetical protein G6W47_04770 [Streptomyces sp. CAI-21]|uniref:hypothetical protein n=1 Tax=Streptomyces sp. CAI-21 TaxID=1169743 RepID=UPI0015875C77|nr:hypothetical protein [Streptomyces sp. CAI-21]